MTTEFRRPIPEWVSYPDLVHTVNILLQLKQLQEEEIANLKRRVDILEYKANANPRD